MAELIVKVKTFTDAQRIADSHEISPTTIGRSLELQEFFKAECKKY